MMDCLRSPMRTLRVTAVLVCALSLAGLGTSQARPSHAPPSIHRHGLPCNAVCKAYMTWSHRVAAMFRPSRPTKMSRQMRPLQKTAAHHGRPPRMMVHHAPRMRQRGLNSFAELRVPSDATPKSAETPRTTETPRAAETPAAETPVTETPRAAETTQAAETPQAEVAPSRPVDKIADRFPTVAEFLTAQRGGADGATDDAEDSVVVAAAETSAAIQGTGTVDDVAADGPDLQLAVSLLLMLGSLPTFLFWWWFRARRDAVRERARLLTFDRALPGARPKPAPIKAAPELAPGASLQTVGSVG